MMWVIFALAAGGVWATSNLTEKLILDKWAKSVWGTLVLFELGNSLIAGIILLFGWKDLAEFWPVIIITALGDIIGVVFYLLALRREETSRVVPLWLLAMIILPLGDAIWLHHILTVQQYLAILGLLILGFLLVFNKQKGLTRSLKVFILMTISTCGYSAMWLLGDTVIKQIAPLYFTAGIIIIRSFIILLTSIFVGWWQKPEVKSVITIKNFKWALFTTIASFSGYALYFLSLQSAIPTLVEAFAMFQYIAIAIAPALINYFRPGTFTEQVSIKQLLYKFVIVSGMIICAILLIV